MNKSDIYTAITHNLAISVVSQYEPQHSNVVANYFVFSYEITINNLSHHAVKLMTREWIIIDSIHGVKIVNGEGVVGQQPIIEPGRSFEYNSWCPLHSTIGQMKGFFFFIDLKTGEELKVEIPTFALIAGFIKN